jgi:hypothetical protein
VHLLTVEGEDVGRPDLAAVSVFWIRPDDPGEAEVELVHKGRTLPLVLIEPGDTVRDPVAPSDAMILPLRTLVREPLATIEVEEGAEGQWTATVGNDHGEFSVDGPSMDAALFEAISELHGDSVPSYTGGLAYNPSCVPDAAHLADLRARGEFLMQLEGRLFGDAGYDFCGGGWLFVHAGGVWSEQ